MRKGKIVIPRWFDRHLHLRQGKMLEAVLPCTLAQKAFGAVVIGNLISPTSTAQRCREYREEIINLLPAGADFHPRMTLFLTDDTKPDEVEEGFKAGIWCAAKLCLTRSDGTGGTTNSSKGVTKLRKLYPVFGRMQKIGMTLLGHFEDVDPATDEFDREAVAMEKYLIPLITNFPCLRVVVEHVSDGRMADFVAGTPGNVRATVTPHHLLGNRNMMFEGGLNSVNYCRPVLKSEEHRRKIFEYVTCGHSRFGAGTDSAPHPIEAKANPWGCSSGIFTAPCAVELYASAFDKANATKNLGPFLSTNFLDFYGLEPSKETMTLVRESWKIPERIANIPVFMGGQTLPWKLVE